MTEDVKVLGIIWDKKADMLHYNINIEKPAEKTTKRIATSIVARIYDPTGYLVPALLGGKILIQEMLRLSSDKPADKNQKKSDWDAALPAELCEKFKEWQTELPRLAEIKIAKLQDGCITQLTTKKKHYLDLQMHL